jgi:REP element-mobilizing transposase RayT
VIPARTGRDLSVHHPENYYTGNHHSENHPEIQYEVELNQYGKIVDERINWLISQYEYVDIHNYVVMPNHLHLILEIDSQRVKAQDVKIKSLSSLMGAMKTTSSNRIHEAGFTDFAWHRSFHDHIIRDEKSYINIFNYISNNPNNWHKDKFHKRD